MSRPLSTIMVYNVYVQNNESRRIKHVMVCETAEIAQKICEHTNTHLKSMGIPCTYYYHEMKLRRAIPINTILETVG